MVYVSCCHARYICVASRHIRNPTKFWKSKAWQEVINNVIYFQFSELSLKRFFLPLFHSAASALLFSGYSLLLNRRHMTIIWHNDILKLFIITTCWQLNITDTLQLQAKFCLNWLRKDLALTLQRLTRLLIRPLLSRKEYDFAAGLEFLASSSGLCIESCPNVKDRSKECH